MRKFRSWALTLLAVVTVATAALVAPAPAPARAAAPTSGVVASGVVTDDLGRPLAGAEVEVYRLGTGLVDVLVTGSSGDFRFAGADTAALWQFRTVAKGYRTLETGWIDVSQHRYQSLKLEPLLGDLQVAVRSSSGKVLSGQAQIVGQAGQLVAELPVRNGSLAQSGLLSGTYRVIVAVPGYLPAAKSVTVAPDRTADLVFALDATGLTLSGEVKDQVTNLPVTGATVEALWEDGTIAATGTTADEGRFQLNLADAASGKYRLRVGAAGYQGAATPAATIAAGQDYDWSGDAAIAVAPLTANISGTIAGVFGAAQKAAKLTLQLQGYGEVATATSNDDGDFRFDRVPVAPGALYRVSFRESSLHVDSPWAELSPGALNEILLRLTGESGYNFGTGKVSGVVTTPSGAPVAGAKVELTRTQIPARSTLTGDDGSFILADLPASAVDDTALAPYTVRITKEGYIPTREFTVGGQRASDLKVTSQSRTSIRAVLSPAAADLRGRVLDQDGKPVPSVTVSVQMDGGTPNDRWNTSTDAFGWYDLKDVPVRPAARYWLRTVAAGYRTPGAQDVTASVADSGSLPTVRLTEESATFTGQAAGPDGSPLSGVSVALHTPDGKVAATATTDELGLYRITARMPSVGAMTLTGALPEMATAVAELAAPPAPGTTTNTDLVLLPDTAVLAGRVLDEANRPRAGVRVELVEEGRGVVATAVTDPQGQYRFSGVSLTGPGWFWLRVRGGTGIFAGSLDSQTELVPLERLMPGETTVTDLLLKSPDRN